jgi:hypothetical protein
MNEIDDFKYNANIAISHGAPSDDQGILKIPVQITCFSDITWVVLELEIDGIYITTTEFGLKYGGDAALDRPTHIHGDYAGGDMYFGVPMEALQNITYLLGDIRCKDYPFNESAWNVFIEPFFPNTDVLAKIPKDFFVMANNQGEDTGDGYNITFKNALFIWGGYQNYIKEEINYYDEYGDVAFSSIKMLVKIME